MLSFSEVEYIYGKYQDFKWIVVSTPESEAEICRLEWDSNNKQWVLQENYDYAGPVKFTADVLQEIVTRMKELEEHA